MKYELLISLKYLLSRRKEKFISLISIISILGVATGVFALIIVIGVMSGFDNELHSRIIGTSSHIVVDKIGGLDDFQQVNKALLSLDEVIAVAPFVNTQALLLNDDGMSSVMVRGIDPALEGRVTSIKNFVKKGNLNLQDSNNIIVGNILAERLFLKVGDKLRLISSVKKPESVFTICGIFSSEMYDYDSAVVFVSLEKAKELAQNPLTLSGISVRIKDIYKANEVKKKIQELLGFPYFTRTWMDLNRNLFNALKLEKTAMFIILTLIVLVASMNIASTLIMMVMEKIKDIGILKAIGVTNKSIRVIFTFVGIFIGLIGTLLGTIAGLIAAYILKTYEVIKLPADVYYINKLPVQVEIIDVAWIIAAAFCISLCATIYPALQASKLNPVEALRYE
ncbi:MAG: ABC transporter permease [Candidatus Omnitrophica bacterium]|nr:ABC transporter permease [Candidatus Omnitrophota bacterium]